MEPDIIVGRLYLPKPSVNSSFLITWFKDPIQPGLLLEVMHRFEASGWSSHKREERHWARFLIDEQTIWILKPTLHEPWSYFLDEVK